MLKSIVYGVVLCAAFISQASATDQIFSPDAQGDMFMLVEKTSANPDVLFYFAETPEGDPDGEVRVGLPQPDSGNGWEFAGGGLNYIGGRGIGNLLRVGAKLKNDILEVGGTFHLESTLFFHVGAGIGVYAQLTPVPVGIGKFVYLHGRVYEVFNTGYFWRGWHTGYGGGLGIRFKKDPNGSQNIIELNVYREHGYADEDPTADRNGVVTIPTIGYGARF